MGVTVERRLLRWGDGRTNQGSRDARMLGSVTLGFRLAGSQLKAG